LKISVVLLPSIVAVGYVEYKLRHVTYSYNLKKQNLESKKDSVEILILGSSEARDGINPDHLSRPAYNLANSSQSLYYDCRLAEKYLDQLPKLKTVFITLSPFSFQYRLNDIKEYWRDYYYYHFWGIYPDGIKFCDPKLYSMIMLITPETSVNWFFKGFNVSLVEDFDENGWQKRDSASYHYLVDESQGRARAEFHQSLMNPSVMESNVNDVLHLLSELEERNIQPVFIMMPVYKTYSSNIDRDWIEKSYDLIHQLDEKHQFIFLDLFYDSSFTIEDYYDNDHLNFMGAKKLTEKLDSILFTPSPDYF